MVIPAFLLTLVLAGLALSALPPRVALLWRHWRRRRQGKAKAEGEEGGGAFSVASSVGTVASLLLVALQGAALFSNSYIEAEERVYLFLGATAVGARALGLAGRGTEAQGSSSSGGGVYCLAQHHLPWLLPGLLTRLAFEAKGHGQDVAAHFGPIATACPLLLLLAGYAFIATTSSSSSSTRRHPRRRGHKTAAVAAAAVAGLLVLLHWAAQADPHDHPFWSDALHLALPRAVFAGCALALLARLGGGGRGDGIAALCLDLAAAISPALLLVLGPAAPASLLCQAGSVIALRQLRPPPQPSPRSPKSWR